MKKVILTALSTFVVGCIIFISCTPKNDDDSIKPTYKDEASSGTGNNPQITNVTTTGTLATTSTQQNSSISNIGSGSSWQYVGCQAAQTCYVVNNASTGTVIELCFFTPPTTGTYQLVGPGQLSPGKATLKVTNPPSQDVGSQWFSYAGGTVSVTAPVLPAVVPYICTFSNIVCNKSLGAQYAVTVSGQVGCQ